MTQEMICVGCPMGCQLTVTGEPASPTVTGHSCAIGDRYAREEISNPTRNIATSVRITGGALPMLSVKTQRPIPKPAIMDCMRAIRRLTLAAPVRIGDVVLADAAGTGVDVLATRTVEAQ